MAATTTTLDGLLKDDYPQIISSHLNNVVTALRLSQKKKRPFVGRQAKYPAHLTRNLSVRALTPGSDLAIAQNQGYQQWAFNAKATYGHIRLTSDVIARTRGRMGAFLQALAQETEGMMKDMARQGNRMSLGTGDGKIGEVLTYAANVITTNFMGSGTAGSGINGNASNRYIRVGDLLDIYTLGGVARNQGALVTAVDVPNNTITITLGTGAAPAATDGIYLNQPDLSTPITKDPLGAGAFFDDGTFAATLGGLSKTTYPLIQAQGINAGTFLAPGILTQPNMQALDDLVIDAGSPINGMIVMGTDVRREFLALNLPQRRFDEPFKYDPGFKADSMAKKPTSTLCFNDRVIVVDNDFPWRTLWYWCEDLIEYLELIPPRFILDGTNDGKQLVPGTAGLIALVMEWHWTLASSEEGMNRGGFMRHISTTIRRPVANG